MIKNEFCVNTLEHGSVWGTVVDFEYLHKSVMEKGDIFKSDFQYCGILKDYVHNEKYSFFHTPTNNYFVKI